MAKTLKRTSRTGLIWKGRLVDSEEGRRLLANPAFRQALEDARHSGAGLDLDESNRQANVTAADLAAADAEIDRLLTETKPPQR
jgi:hypothetical protein